VTLPRIDLPAELPWQTGDLLNWPKSVLFAGRRWLRYTYFVDDARNPDGRVIEIHNPDGLRLYRGESDACADTLVRIDMVSKYESGRFQKPKTMMADRSAF